MDVSKDDAAASLGEVAVVTVQSRRALVASYASGLLILWGGVWVTAFLGTHFFLEQAWVIWPVLNLVGIAGTYVICQRQLEGAEATRILAAKKIGQRLFWFWAAWYVYVGVWLSIFADYSGLQMNAFICTACMFAYIVIGFWFECYFLVGLALAVTGLTLIACHSLPDGWYNLWMALTGGGAILGTGLYIRIFWK